MANKETKTKSKIKKEVGTKKSNTQNNSESIVTEERYFTVQLDTFLFNAGIIGFIEVLKTAGAEKGKSKDDKKDYFIDVQNLEVSKEFLKSADLAQGYIKVLFDKFASTTRWYKLCNINISSITIKIIDSYTAMFDGKTITTVCNITDDKKFLEIIEIFNEIKKDDEKKIETFKNIINYLNNSKNKKLKEYLILSQIAFYRMSLIYTNIAFLKYDSKHKIYSINKKLDLEESVKQNCFKPYFDFVDFVDNKKSSSCIICNRNFKKDSNKKFKIPISFLINLVEAMTRKTSAYWNYKPDTYICPVCYMIYACSILGFTDTGNGIIFSNFNSGIEELEKINTGLKIKTEEVKKINIINRIIKKILEIKTQELSSVQIISKIKTNKYYSVDIISENILRIIKKCTEELETLSKIKNVPLFKNEKNKINIFDECLKNIFSYSNQYNLMLSLLKSDVAYSSVIYKLLKIQINQKYNKGDNMGKDEKEKIENVVDKLRNAERARRSGYKLKKDLGDPEDADNKLKGFIYQLLNAIQTGNRELFYNIIIRMYTGNDLSIPKILSEASKSIDDFNEIGYAFILGLKSSDGKKNK